MGINPNPTEMNLGRWAEKQVKQLLIDHGWTVNDVNQPLGEGAPLLEGPEGKRRLPDLRASKGYGVKGRYVEVKAKTNGARRFGIADEYRHGIEQPQYDDYCLVEEETGTDLWLFIYEGDTGDLLRGKLGGLEVVQRTMKLWRDAGGAVLFRRGDFGVVPVTFEQGQQKIHEGKEIIGGVFGEEPEDDDQTGLGQFSEL